MIYLGLVCGDPTRIRVPGSSTAGLRRNRPGTGGRADHLPERGDNGVPRTIDQRFLVRLGDVGLATNDVARQLFKRALTGTRSALVDEQTTPGLRRKPAQLAPHAVALLVYRELEPGAERNGLEVLEHPLLVGIELQRGLAQRSGAHRPFLARGVAQMGLALQAHRDLGLRGRILLARRFLGREQMPHDRLDLVLVKAELAESF